MTRLAAAIATVAATAAAMAAGVQRATPPQPRVESRSVPVLTIDGARFRDLDRSGALDPYEDWRLTPDRRAADLTGRMTLEEKAGVMMHGTAPVPRGGPAAGYDLAAAEKIILGAGVNSLITRLGGDARVLAEQNNALQEIAERARLGIPLTISTDPRNHFQYTLGISVAPDRFAQWPETLGLAAIGDAALVRRFAETARQEYRAAGITMALSPQADLATEPRWPRIAGTFGENADLARDLVKAYVEGFQNGDAGIGPDSVVTIVKHWVGYSAAVNGFDGHNHYGRFSRLDGALDVHIRPFEGAFAAKVGGVMPTYTILEDVTVDGRPIEQVGGGYNRTLLTALLRGRYGFEGVILSDWGITRDCGENCRTGAAPHTFADIAMPWGVESLSVTARFARGVEAGLDQFGGTDESHRLVEAVRSGALTEARLDESVRRILVQKFQLGLFERPFVDPARAAEVVGAAAFRAEAEAAQRQSLVVLENRTQTLPLRAGARVFVHGLDPAAVRAAGLQPVDRLEEAEVAIVRASAPFERLHPNFFFGRMHHEGRLDFRDGDADYEQIETASARVPTIVAIYLDRPAILTNVRDKAHAIVANFGVNDRALLDVLIGRAQARGRLPFELPSSMADVEAQAPGRPHDTRQPLYKIGTGAASARSQR